MTKRLYYKLYWADEPPSIKEVTMTRYNAVRDGASTKGAVIGSLGTGAKLIVDENEVDIGWTRIISVVGHDPVPANWQEIERDKGRPVEEWEWWIDNTAITPVTEPGSDLKLEITIHPDMTFDVRKV